ncbi:ATP-grasp domain-containing protein [Methylobacillus caricis]|uniref:ATP-grasp domain-containing protein n=1 Tax=Methylobacillus caricis TaxID=1971611 RepID=UPI001CFFB006|nr:ATP-grasp domain-containing protein [Methylobacillus caricis]MCB5187276.1 ATP-grasp domain-containing protein [Methylobacillus caricis]
MAANVRPYVTAAAAAGYEVLAADVFGDEDTLAASCVSLVLEYGNKGFSPEAIRQDLIPAIKEFGAECLLYGSGFEAQPEMLDELAKNIPLAGNHAEAVASCKDPQRFLAACLANEIPVPPTCLNAQALPGDDIEQWLCKRQGGCGGMHITSAKISDGADVYFQRRVAGVPVSLLFFAGATRITALGLQRQLLDPLGTELPYRYGGLVGPLEVAALPAQGLLDAAHKLAAEFGLRGLNSLDAMVDGDQYWVLEINPRLSASLSLYEMQPEWLKAHIHASMGQPVELPVIAAGQVKANLVFYAPFEVKISADFKWPEWVVDVPLANTEVAEGSPLCTVLAVADDDRQAEELARVRAALLNTMLKHIQKIRRTI